MGLAGGEAATRTPDQGNGLPGILQAWCTGDHADPPAALLAALQVAEDPFWSWHWTWNSRRLSRPQPLMGASRMSDLAVNIILPWLWAHAVEHKSGMQETLERLYFNWPASPGNSVLRLAGARLLGRSNCRLRGAAAQQGLMQIVRDFCANSNAICENCSFPEVASRCA
jgi:hypothetical protein